MTYFVSQVGLDAGITPSDANNGTSNLTPWLTVTKVNGFAFVSGDVVQFRRNGVWRAVTLNIHTSNITYRDYGAGSLPRISGFQTTDPNTWAAGTGANNFQFNIGITTCQVVLLDRVFQVYGKLPRGNQGYYNVTSFNCTTPSLTGTTASPSGLNLNFSTSGAPNIVGGEVCWRAFHWVLWRGTVTAQNTGAGTISISPFPSTGGGPLECSPVNYGFFLQNHPLLCTQQGDWSLQGTTLTMNFASGRSGHIVEYCVLDNVVQMNANSNVTFINMAFEGANVRIIAGGNNSASNTLNGCTLFAGGLHGININGTGTNNWTISGCTVSWVTSTGLRQSTGSGTGWVISDSTFDNCGSVAGMGGSGESAQYCALITKTGAHIIRNKITNTGYLPIFWDGANCLIQDNYVDTYGFVKDDAGGIYCDGVFGTPKTGSIVDHNIVVNGLGAPAGTSDTDQRTNGIYADDAAASFAITNNSVGNIGNYGIFLHVANTLDIHDNTFYNCGVASFVIRNVDDTGGGNTTSNINWHNNICVARAATQNTMNIPSGTPATWFLTTTDNNHYGRPITSDGAIFNGGAGNLTLPQWRTLLTSPRELNSAGSPAFISNLSMLSFIFNINNVATPFPLNPGTYVDMLNNSYSGSVTLQPFTSVVLIQTSSSGGGPRPHSHGQIIS